MIPNTNTSKIKIRNLEYIKNKSFSYVYQNGSNVVHGELETHHMNMTINTNEKNVGEHKNIKNIKNIICVAMFFDPFTFKPIPQRIKNIAKTYYVFYVFMFSIPRLKKKSVDLYYVT